MATHKNNAISPLRLFGYWLGITFALIASIVVIAYSLSLLVKLLPGSEKPRVYYEATVAGDYAPLTGVVRD